MQILDVALNDGLHVLQAGLVGEDALEVARRHVAFTEAQTVRGDA